MNQNSSVFYGTIKFNNVGKDVSHSDLSFILNLLDRIMVDMFNREEFVQTHKNYGIDGVRVRVIPFESIIKQDLTGTEPVPFYLHCTGCSMGDILNRLEFGLGDLPSDLKKKLNGMNLVIDYYETTKFGDLLETKEFNNTVAFRFDGELQLKASESVKKLNQKQQKEIQPEVTELYLSDTYTIEGIDKLRQAILNVCSFPEDFPYIDKLDGDAALAAQLLDESYREKMFYKERGLYYDSLDLKGFFEKYPKKDIVGHREAIKLFHKIVPDILNIEFE